MKSNASCTHEILSFSSCQAWPNKSSICTPIPSLLVLLSGMSSESKDHEVSVSDKVSAACTSRVAGRFALLLLLTGWATKLFARKIISMPAEIHLCRLVQKSEVRYLGIVGRLFLRTNFGTRMSDLKFTRSDLR